MSCVFRDVRENLNTDHAALIQLYRKARALPGINLAPWLKRNNFRFDQVQTFLPTPLALATGRSGCGQGPAVLSLGHDPIPQFEIRDSDVLGV